MRIAIFTDTYLPDKNGISTSIENFTRLLAEDGHKIMIFCPKSKFYMDKKIKNLTVKRYKALTLPSYKDVSIALPSIINATTELKKFKPDVIHIQTPMGIGWIGIWASKILKIKSVQTYHSYIPDFLVYIKPQSLLGINKIAGLIKNIATIKDLVEPDSKNFVRFKKQLERETNRKIKKSNKVKPDKGFAGVFTRAVYNSADLVLTPSRSMKKVIVGSGIKVNVEVLSNGINYDFFKKKTDFKVKNRIFYMGRLGYEKNVDVVIKAFAIAVKENPKLRLDLLGDGPARKYLQGLAKTLGVNKQIRFLGAYDIKDMSERLCKYDCFVTASTIETQGLVIIESMASGLPVLGVKKFAIPEVVLDGKNGYTSDPFDVNGMAENMLKITESEARITKFSKKSLEVAKSHELVGCKDRLVSLYEQAIRG